MFEHIHARNYLEKESVIRVHLKDACWVRVMDDMNYNRFRRSEDYRAIVDVVSISPHDVVVPHSGMWNVVLDLNGSAGNIRHRIEYYS